MLKATVSGSFHRHMDAITSAVSELGSLSVKVLSPSDPRVVDAHGEFLFVASDRVRSVRLVQDRHMEAIRSSDFLWLVCPDGYVGQSASMEIGFAAGANIPIFAIRAPSDLTLREYISIAPSLKAAVREIGNRPHRRRSEGLLIDPHASVEQAHQILERIDAELAKPSSFGDTSGRVHQNTTDLRAILTLPTYLN